MRLIEVERQLIGCKTTGFGTVLGGELGEGGGEKVPGARSFLVDQYHTHSTPPTQVQPIFGLPHLLLS